MEANTHPAALIDRVRLRQLYEIELCAASSRHRRRIVLKSQFAVLVPTLIEPASVCRFAFPVVNPRKIKL
jgi:hypothetical protein